MHFEPNMQSQLLENRPQLAKTKCQLGVPMRSPQGAIGAPYRQPTIGGLGMSVPHTMGTFSDNLTLGRHGSS